MTKNVYKMTDIVYKTTEIVYKITEKNDLKWPRLTSTRAG
jgi:hypothetical protein